jgi:hypothetical protein
VGVGQGEADVVGQRADVAGMVVEAFELEHQGPQPLGRLGHGDAQGVLHGEAVREGVTSRGVTADPFGEMGRAGGLEPLEQLLDPAVGEPEPGLELEDALPDDGEAEVAGLDDAGVDRADRDLIDPVAFDRQEGEGLGVGERRRWSGVAAHRVPASGPVRVPDQPAGQRVADRDDPVQVMHLTLEA